jgi:hypothetical protein
MRTATAARIGVGALCVVAPGRVLGAVRASDRDDRRVRRSAQVLGVRLLLQAGVDVASGRPHRDLDIVVELTHAATMLPVAMLSPAHRRSATVSAAVATGIAVLDLTHRQPPSSSGRREA